MRRNLTKPHAKALAKARNKIETLELELDNRTQELEESQGREDSFFTVPIPSSLTDLMRLEEVTREF